MSIIYIHNKYKIKDIAPENSLEKSVVIKKSYDEKNISNNDNNSINWWFCDELLKSDCTHKNVQEHCPNLC